MEECANERERWLEKSARERERDWRRWPGEIEREREAPEGM